MKVNDGDRRKNPKTKPRKNFPFGCSPIPPLSTKMETENTGGPNLVGVKKYRVGYGVGSLYCRECELYTYELSRSSIKRAGIRVEVQNNWDRKDLELTTR